MLLMTVMSFLSFTMSRSLNRESESSQRATVLSVKGLAFNLGYGSFSLAFSGFLASMAGSADGKAFGAALFWQVPFYAVLVGAALLWGKWLLRDDRTGPLGKGSN